MKKNKADPHQSLATNQQCMTCVTTLEMSSTPVPIKSYKCFHLVHNLWIFHLKGCIKSMFMMDKV